MLLAGSKLMPTIFCVEHTAVVILYCDPSPAAAFVITDSTLTTSICIIQDAASAPFQFQVV